MIEKILDKPEHHRRRIAFIATSVIGVFIFSAWLVIANFNIRQAFNPLEEKDTKMAQGFKDSLPSLRQSETVTTELAKDQSATTQNDQDVEEAVKEDKPFWKFW